MISSIMYSSLPTDRSFRLLKLSLTNTNVLSLQLSVHSLDNDTPNFDALSYTWGSPISTQRCLDDYDHSHDVCLRIVTSSGEHETKVGRNLFEALLRIARMDSSYIWVDALCINQRDIMEKNLQVGMMGEIYSTAVNTNVWLGVDDPDRPVYHHISFIHGEFFERLPRFWRHDLDFSKIDWDDYTDPESDLVFDFEPRPLRLKRQMVDDLYYFYQTRRYLCRAWILQEVFLGKPRVLLGTEQVNFARFSAIASLLIGVHNIRRAYIQDDGGGLGGELLAMDWRTKDTTLLPLARNEDGSFFEDHDAREAAYYQTMHKLLSLGVRQASDPRDLLFAYHGIAQSLTNAVGFRPDYSIDTDQVHLAFMSKALQYSLDWLQSSIGSWIPEPGQIPGSSLDILEYTQDVMPCAGGTHRPVVVDSSGDLMVRGWQCATISKVFTPCEQSIEADREPDRHKQLLSDVNAPRYMQVFEFLETTDIIALESLLRATSFELCDDSSVFLDRLRTSLKLTVLDNVAAKNMATAEKLMSAVSNYPDLPTVDELRTLAEMVSTYLSKDCEEEEMPQCILDLLEARTSVLAFHVYADDSFIKTEDNRYGRARYNPRVGDQIWLLCGAKAPFVLRPKDGKFEIVSDAVIHGVMFGELLDDLSDSETECVCVGR